MITSMFQVCLSMMHQITSGALCVAHSQNFVHMDESTLVIRMIYSVDDEMCHSSQNFIQNHLDLVF